MGRREIDIKPIADARVRKSTFLKRKSGLIKKAMELSILCNCEVALVIFDAKGDPIQYSGGDIEEILAKFLDKKPLESYCNEDYSEKFGKDKRMLKSGDKSDDEQGSPPLQIANHPATAQPPVVLHPHVHAHHAGGSHETAMQQLESYLETQPHIPHHAPSQVQQAQHSHVQPPLDDADHKRKLDESWEQQQQHPATHQRVEDDGQGGTDPRFWRTHSGTVFDPNTLLHSMPSESSLLVNS